MNEAPKPPSLDEINKAQENFEDTVITLLLQLHKNVEKKNVIAGLDRDMHSGRAFYASYLINMKKIYSNQVPTAGVSITDGINLYINPSFFNGLSLAQRIEVLMHECEHLLHFHHVRFSELKEGNAKIYNVASDATINERLKSLHEMGVTVDGLNKMYPNLKFDKSDTSEEHYDKLMEERDKLLQDIKDGKVKLVDSHEIWGECENVDYAKSVLLDSIESTVKQVGAGNTPQHVLEELENFKKSNINWKQQLRKYITRCAASKKQKTRVKRNRRYGVLFQGRKKAPELVLTLLLDESGSVCNEQFTQFWAEIEKIAPLAATINIVNFDAKVNSVYEYKKNMKIKRTGCGGTMFAPAFEKAKELKSDAVICFTDGYPCDTITKPSFPVLWASTSADERPFDFGDFLRVRVGK